MSDFHQSRSYPPNHLAGSGSGSGLFWVLAAIAGLGLLVLIGAFGNMATTVPHPGGAGAEPVAVPDENAALPQTGTLVD
ncbi:hypothetical protein EI983_11120 [Roseovarius faecimaris]|uniref:Uncharacterized protein n=1 Tax=Roseovarius faecimaris TaxID=2494550 RepID=A0A6I6INU0_9RHOB|nr:hypothetical protein [Roseovarius faecimaris]QGX98790.1 hypothetical protein EI983_11120 [Roseovarius faecimaris]